MTCVNVLCVNCCTDILDRSRYVQIHSDAYRLTVFVLASSLQPLREVPHKVEEEVSIGYTDDLVTDLHKQREPFSRLQPETLGDVGAEVFRTSVGVHLKCLAQREWAEKEDGRGEMGKDPGIDSIESGRRMKGE